MTPCAGGARQTGSGGGCFDSRSRPRKRHPQNFNISDKKVSHPLIKFNPRGRWEVLVAGTTRDAPRSVLRSTRPWTITFAREGPCQYNIVDIREKSSLLHSLLAQSSQVASQLRASLRTTRRQRHRSSTLLRSRLIADLPARAMATPLSALRQRHCRRWVRTMLSVPAPTA
jgi:hypothetical protein